MALIHSGFLAFPALEMISDMTTQVTMVDDLDRVVKNWVTQAYTGFQDTGPVKSHRIFIDTKERKIITIMEVEKK